QTGVPTNTDLTASPGNVQLLKPTVLDQSNTNVSTNGFGFSNTSWVAQTFTAGVTGQATKVDVDLFCSSCSGNPPNVTISIRNATNNLPTGSDLAVGSTAFSADGAGGYFSVSFASPPTLTAGIQYAVVARMAAAYGTGTPAYVVSSSSTYANGRRAT